MTARTGRLCQFILDHPIIRLELRRVRRKRWWPGRRIVRWGLMLLLIGGVVGTCSLIPRTSYSLMRLGVALDLVVPLLSSISAWIVPAVAGSTIVRERELGTFDLLRTTLLTERSIVLGKLGACLVRLWPGILALMFLSPLRMFWGWTGLLDLFSYYSWGSQWAGGMWLVRVLAFFWPWVHLMFHAAIGLSVSTQCRSSGMAVAASYAAVLVMRIAMGLGLSFVVPALVIMLPFYFPDDRWDQISSALELGGGELVIMLVEIFGTVMLIWRSVWRLRRMSATA